MTDLPTRIENARPEDVRGLRELDGKLTKAQWAAIIEGRVHDCPYNHPRGTRCPNCANWPFKKGGAADFVNAVRQRLEQEPTT